MSQIIELGFYQLGIRLEQTRQLHGFATSGEAHVTAVEFAPVVDSIDLLRSAFNDFSKTDILGRGDSEVGYALVFQCETLWQTWLKLGTDRLFRDDIDFSSFRQATEDLEQLFTRVADSCKQQCPTGLGWLNLGQEICQGSWHYQVDFEPVWRWADQERLEMLLQETGSDLDQLFPQLEVYEKLPDAPPGRGQWDRVETGLHEWERKVDVALGTQTSSVAIGERADLSPSNEEGPPESPLKTPKAKRSTVRGEGPAKLIAALTKHHQYANGGCLEKAPIGVNELADLADVSSSTVSKFFNDTFNNGEKEGHAKYRLVCNHTGRLLDSLKALNGEFRPHHLNLYGRRPAGEDDRHDDSDDARGNRD